MGLAETIAAALLHAANDQGDFGDGRSGPTARHRQRISKAVGGTVETLVYDYHRLGWGPRKDTSAVDGTDPRVLLIRVANEIDDALDGGLVLSGKERLPEHCRSMHELDVHLAERFGTPMLASLASEVLLTSPTRFPSVLLVGAVRSRVRLPASARYRLLPWLPQMGDRAARRGRAVLRRVVTRR